MDETKYVAVPQDLLLCLTWLDGIDDRLKKEKTEASQYLAAPQSQVAVKRELLERLSNSIPQAAWADDLAELRALLKAD